MRRSNANELRVLSRRAKIAEMLLRGESNHYEITRRLGMEATQRGMISRDIAAIKWQWKASTLRDFDEAKGHELARLETLEKEAWEAWDRSKGKSRRNRAKRRTGGDKTLEETELQEFERDGDPRFLSTVLDCIKRRCDILGLDAPKKNEHAGPGGGDIRVKHEHRISLDDFNKLPLAERVAILRAQISSPATN